MSAGQWNETRSPELQMVLNLHGLKCFAWLCRNFASVIHQRPFSWRHEERAPSAWLISPSSLSFLEAYAKIVIRKRIFFY